MRIGASATEIFQTLFSEVDVAKMMIIFEDVPEDSGGGVDISLERFGLDDEDTLACHLAHAFMSQINQMVDDIAEGGDER